MSVSSSAFAAVAGRRVRGIVEFVVVYFAFSLF